MAGRNKDDGNDADKGSERPDPFTDTEERTKSVDKDEKTGGSSGPTNGA